MSATSGKTFFNVPGGGSVTDLRPNSQHSVSTDIYNERYSGVHANLFYFFDRGGRKIWWSEKKVVFLQPEKYIRN